MNPGNDASGWERPPEYDDEPEPPSDEDTGDAVTECDCDNGWVYADGIATECGECGGTGYC